MKTPLIILSFIIPVLSGFTLAQGNEEMAGENAPEWRATGGPRKEREGFEEIRNIFVHPTNSSTAYAYTNSGFYKTSDYGETWEQFGPDKMGGKKDILFHPLDPKRIFVISNGILWTTENEKDWSKIYEKKDNPVLSLMFHENNENTFYCLHKKSLATTIDNGKSWTVEKYDIETGNSVYPSRTKKPMTIDISPKRLRLYIPGSPPRDVTPEGQVSFRAAVNSRKDPSRIAIMERTRIFFTNNAGKNWKTARIPNISVIRWVKFHPQDDNRLILATYSRGIFEYNLNSGKMSRIGKKRIGYRIHCISISPDATTLWAGTAHDGVWIYTSDKPLKGGKIFKKAIAVKAPAGGSPKTIAIHPKDPNIVYIGGYDCAYTLDGGKTWWRIRGSSDHIHHVTAMAFAPSKPEIMYALFCKRLWKSTNTGYNWYSHRDVNFRVDTINIDPYDPEVIFVCSLKDVKENESNIHISHDGAKNFKSPGKQLEGWKVRQVFFDNAQEGIAFLSIKKNDRLGVAVTNNHGKTWKVQHFPGKWENMYIRGVRIDTEDDDLMFARISDHEGTEESYWYRYTDDPEWDFYYRKDSEFGNNTKLETKIKKLFPEVIKTPIKWEYDPDQFVTAPSDPKIAYFASPFLVRTTNGGKKWEDASTNAFPARLNHILADPYRPERIICNIHRGIYWSDDYGESWKKIKFAGKGRIEKLFFHPHEIGTFFFTRWGELWKADRNDVVAKQILTTGRDQIRTMTFSSKDPKSFHCYSNNIIYNTSDGGEMWEMETAPSEIKDSFASSFRGEPALVVSPKGSTKLLWYSPGKELRKTDLFQLSKGKRRLSVYSLTMCAEDSSRVAFLSDNILFVTTDSGKTWKTKDIPGDKFNVLRVSFNPRHRNLLVLLSRRGGIGEYDIKTGEFRRISIDLESITVGHLGVSYDGNTYWIGRFSGHLWYLRRMPEEDVPASPKDG